NIVPVYDVGHTADGLSFVTRFIEGTDLAQRLRAGPRLSFVQSAELVAAVAEALHHAHLRAWFTAMSSRPTSCWTGQGGPTWPTSAWHSRSRTSGEGPGWWARLST